MSKTTIDSRAVRLFSPDENQQIADGWFCFSELPQTVAAGNAPVAVFAQPSTTASNPHQAFVELIDAENLRIWRGTRVLTEEQAARTEFPYPPEPDWESE